MVGQNRRDANYDVVFVGGGFRLSTFLASCPSLLTRHRVAIVEARNAIGPGAFGQLSGTSNSSGRSFFRDVDPGGEFGWIYSDPLIAQVANSTEPVSIQALANALGRLGAEIQSQLTGEQLRLRRRAMRITLEPEAPRPAKVVLDDGEILRARICVLTSGRHERALDSYTGRDYVWCSAEVLAPSRVRELKQQVIKASGGEIVVLGSSHSAFSVLERLLQVFADLQIEQYSRNLPRIRVIHRNRVRICYRSADQALKEITDEEESFDAAQHICRDTGIVFRDSGLRHQSIDLYRAIRAGKVPSIEMNRVPALNSVSRLIDSSAFVIQALGYVANAPDIWIGSRRVRPATSNEPIAADADGFARFGVSSWQSPLAAIRIDPTPKSMRDFSSYGSGLYRILGDAILTRLGTFLGH